MSNKKMRVIAPVILCAVVAGGYYWWSQVRYVESTNNAYIQADISHVSAKVPGYVVQADVVDNQHVNKGDLLAQLEDNQFNARVEQADAQLASAKAELQTLAAKVDLQGALINQAQAGVVAAVSDRKIALQQLARSQKLKISNYSSQDNVDQLQSAFDSSSAHLDQAKAALVAKQRELAVFTAQLTQLDSDVKQARASLALAKIQLQDTRITAPFSGVIGKRGALVGQYVQPGQALFSLVPDTGVWINANFKETQIQHMQVGQRVKVSVDAFPGTPFYGVVDSFSPASGSQFSLLPTENATGNFTKIVQRIPVRIRLEADDLIGRTELSARTLNAEVHSGLIPGLSVVVDVDTSEATAQAELVVSRAH
jgi:membrane fusion protein (multidrug efflux system)